MAGPDGPLDVLSDQQEYLRRHSRTVEAPMAPTTHHTDPEVLDMLLTLDPSDIDRLTWQPVTGCPGVDEKELWRFGDFVDALLRYRPGSSTPGHPHLAAEHHIWVISGAATIAGRPVVAGTYAHVPPGVEHPIGNVGAEGCTLLQMHRPHPPPEAEARDR